MSGYTPKLNLPYPTGTDPVSGGDNVIQALATALDGSTAWTLVTAVTSGFAVNALGYRKDGVGNVHLVGGMQKPGVPSGNAFTLPVGFRPPILVTGCYLDIALAGHPVIAVNVFPSGDVNWAGPGVSGSDAGLSIACNLVFSTVPRP